MTVNAAKAPAKAEIEKHAGSDLRKVYLAIYTRGPLDYGDIVSQCHVNQRYARELTGVLAQYQLILNPDENDTATFTYNLDAFEEVGVADSEEEAERLIDQFLEAHGLNDPKNPAMSTPSAPAKPRGTRVKSANASGLCTCGCGTSTRSLFAPGHDARMAGQVARELAEETIAAGDGMTSERVGEILAPLPSALLRDKAWRIAQGLIAKASTKGRADRKEREARDGDRPTVSIHEVVDEVSKQFVSDPALEPTYTYGTVKVGRQSFPARRDADGVITRTNEPTVKGAEFAPEELSYTGSVEGKPAQTFKVLD